jgi:hypothetical protein
VMALIAGGGNSDGDGGDDCCEMVRVRCDDGSCSWTPRETNLEVRTVIF